MIRYLHELGVVFHQANLFASAIILDQSWALEAAYAVFEREKSYRQIVAMGGRFTLSLLAMTVWGDYTEAERALFLSLMESADICFPRREEDARAGVEAEYVAPDLLPTKVGVADQLAGRWDEAEPTARLEFHYPFIHEGLIRSLICDAGKLAKEAGVYWKYGVWVYDKESGARLLIERLPGSTVSGTHGGIISVRLQGERAARLAQWVRERFTEHNRRYGCAHLVPAVDELPKVEETRATEAATDVGIAPAPQPALGPLPPSAFPPRGPAIYISYAWGDETPEGKRRVEVVDEICRALGAQRVTIHRDNVDLETGDRISEFMNRLIEGDVIVVVLSDRYLRSPYCMYELFGIYRRRGDEAGRFLRSVVPIVLPDAKLSDPLDRLEYADFWKQRRDALSAKLQQLGFDYAGVEIPKEYRLVEEFARHVADILTHVKDKLMPRDLAVMRADGFRAIRDLVAKADRQL